MSQLVFNIVTQIAPAGLKVELRNNQGHKDN
jgi:hypothetical protein